MGPWSAHEAREKDSGALREAIDGFVDGLDWERVYEDVVSLRSSLGCDGHCTLIRAASAEAARSFAARGVRFGLIHIDGNHDTEIALGDVRAYLPRLEEGGFLIVDDVSWASVGPAFDRAAKELTLIYERRDAANDYAVFMRPSIRRALFLRAALRLIARG